MLYNNLLFVLSLLLSVSIARRIDGGINSNIVEKAISVMFPNEEDLFGEYPSNNEVRGTVTFEITDTFQTRIYGEIVGLPKHSKFGFHVHEFGNISIDCNSTGPHYDPFLTKTHGGPDSEIRHVGDLGNIWSDGYGIAEFEIFDDMITLNGDNNVIGRGIVIHQDPDDLVTNPTGNSGGRLACGVIGIAKETNNDYPIYTPSPIYNDYTPSPVDYNSENDHYQSSCIAFVLERDTQNEETRYLVNGVELQDIFSNGCPRWEIRPAFGFGCDGECFSIKYVDNDKFLNNDFGSFNSELSPKVNGDKELWFIESGRRNKGIKFINKESHDLLCMTSVSVGRVGMFATDIGLCDWDIDRSF